MMKLLVIETGDSTSLPSLTQCWRLFLEEVESFVHEGRDPETERRVESKEQTLNF